MLGATDLPVILDRFKSVYVIDAEFYGVEGLPDGPVVPVALQAYEVHTGTWISLFFKERNVSYANPLDPRGLFIGFNLSAEWNCLLSLGWQLPKNSLDLYIEFKNLISALKPPLAFRNPKNPDKWNSSLLGVVKWCGLVPRVSADKDAARDRILRGHPFSTEDQELILSYCRDDVVDTALIAERMLPRIGSLPQAVFRAHFMRAVARIQRVGIPIDAHMYSQLIKHRDTLKLQIAGQLAGTQMNVYEGVTLKYSKLEALIHSLGLEDVWPSPARRKSKRLVENASRSRKVKVFSTEVESFEAMAVLHPDLTPLATVVKQMGDLKAFDLVVGTDSCSRYPVFPFSTNTGRCAPPSKRFLFQQSAWTRGFIAPPSGWAISYLDYSAAEVLIAAVLSGDRALLDDCLSGDPYMNCAIRMGLAPNGSTKASIGPLRDILKVWLLSTLYGASAKSLHDKLERSTLQQAEDFICQNHASYSQYWHWSNLRSDIFLYENGIESTVFGWCHHLDPSERNDDWLFLGARNRSRNFSMQATCAEILRWACVFATDDNIVIHAPVHDAVLIGAQDAEIEDAITRMRRHMIAASKLVLGVAMKVPDPTIIRYPNRMRDHRGAKVWDDMTRRLANLDQKAEAL